MTGKQNNSIIEIKPNELIQYKNKFKSIAIYKEEQYESTVELINENYKEQALTLSASPDDNDANKLHITAKLAKYPDSAVNYKWKVFGVDGVTDIANTGNFEEDDDKLTIINQWDIKKFITIQAFAYTGGIYIASSDILTVYEKDANLISAITADFSKDHVVIPEGVTDSASIQTLTTTTVTVYRGEDNITSLCKYIWSTKDGSVTNLINSNQESAGGNVNGIKEFTNSIDELKVIIEVPKTTTLEGSITLEKTMSISRGGNAVYSIVPSIGVINITKLNIEQDYTFTMQQLTSATGATTLTALPTGNSLAWYYINNNGVAIGEKRSIGSPISGVWTFKYNPNFENAAGFSIVLSDAEGDVVDSEQITFIQNGLDYTGLILAASSQVFSTSDPDTATITLTAQLYGDLVDEKVSWYFGDNSTPGAVGQNPYVLSISKLNGITSLKIRAEAGNGKHSDTITIYKLNDAITAFFTNELMTFGADVLGMVGSQSSPVAFTSNVKVFQGTTDVTNKITNISLTSTNSFSNVEITPAYPTKSNPNIVPSVTISAKGANFGTREITSGKFSFTVTVDGIGNIPLDLSWIKIPAANGINNIEEYYQATATNNAPNPYSDANKKIIDTSWKTTIVAAGQTKEKPYLWNFERIKKDNGDILRDTDVSLLSSSPRTIVSTTEYYTTNTTGVIPAGAAYNDKDTEQTGNVAPKIDAAVWKTVEPTLAQGEYLYNFEVVQYAAVDADNKNLYTWTEPVQMGYAGNDGRAIGTVIEYYARSKTETNKPIISEVKDNNGIVLSEAWSTTLTAPDKDLPYLWNYEVSRYNDTNNTQAAATDPVVIAYYTEDGANGRGIRSIENYYQLRSDEKSPTITSSDPISAPPTTGSPVVNTWYNAPVQTTAINKYLWNCEKITYDDGSDPTFTVPACIGTHGTPGAAGADLQVKYKNSATIPSANDSGWQDTIPSPVEGQYLYMIQKLSNASAWSTPVQMSAKDGITPTVTIDKDNNEWIINDEHTGVQVTGDPGDTPVITIKDGYWVIDEVKTTQKAQGETGKDGADIEYVYYRSETEQVNLTAPSYNNGTLTSGWTASPQGITSAWKYEYVSIRTKPAGVNTNWTPFSTPVIWSKWGEKGFDGDGVSYWYYRTNTEGIYNYSSGATGWTDEPQGVDKDNRYEYVVSVTYDGETDAYTIHNPGKLWAKWGEDSTVPGPAGPGIESETRLYKWGTNQPTPDKDGLEYSELSTYESYKNSGFLWMYYEQTWTDNRTPTYTTPIRMTDYEMGTLMASKENMSISQWCTTYGRTLIDGSTIATGSVTANQINTAGLSAEYIKSNNYKPGTEYAESGFQITSTSGNPLINSPNFRVDQDGTLHAKAGKIGNVSIDNVASTTDIDNIQIGGRNLLRFTSGLPIDYTLQNGIGSWSQDGLEDTGEGLKTTPNNNTNRSFHIPLAGTGIVNNNESITLSFEYRGDYTSFGAFYYIKNGGPNLSRDCSDWTITPSSEKWQKFEATFAMDNINNDAGQCTGILLFYAHNLGDGKGTWIEIKKGSLKLERGNKATDWTPAPEDTTAEFAILNNAISAKVENSYTGTSIDWAMKDDQFKVTAKAEGKTGGITVDKDGLAVAGTIQATKGNIGNWQIESPALKDVSGKVYLNPDGQSATVNSTNLNNIVINANDKFAVTKDGAVYATAGKIGNVEITKVASTDDTATKTQLQALDGKIESKVESSTYNSKMTQLDKAIEAKVTNSQTNKEVNWSMTDTAFTVTAKDGVETGGITVDKNGLMVTGTIHATGGDIGGVAIGDIASTDAVNKAKTAAVDEVKALGYQTKSDVTTITKNTVTTTYINGLEVTAQTIKSPDYQSGNSTPVFKPEVLADDNGNLVADAVVAQYQIIIDSQDNIIGEDESHIRIDYFIAYDYKNNINGETVPVIYKTDSDYPNEPDYGDPCYYIGTREYNGIIYDAWEKINDEIPFYILTNIVIDQPILAKQGFQITSQKGEFLIDSKNFQVTQEGELTAKSGKIAGWEITDDRIQYMNDFGQTSLIADQSALRISAGKQDTITIRVRESYMNDVPSELESQIDFDGCLLVKFIFTPDATIFDKIFNIKNSILSNVYCYWANLEFPPEVYHLECVSWEKDYSSQQIIVYFKTKETISSGIVSRTYAIDFDYEYHNYPFMVMQNGSLFATEGKIAGWTIDDTIGIYKQTNTNHTVGMHLTNSSEGNIEKEDEDIAFWAGGPSLNSQGIQDNATFYVQNNGTVTCKKLNVRGGTINGANVEKLTIGNTSLAMTSNNNAVLKANNGELQIGGGDSVVTFKSDGTPIGEYKLFVRAKQGSENQLWKFRLECQDGSGNEYFSPVTLTNVNLFYKRYIGGQFKESGELKLGLSISAGDTCGEWISHSFIVNWFQPDTVEVFKSSSSSAYITLKTDRTDTEHVLWWDSGVLNNVPYYMDCNLNILPNIDGTTASGRSIGSKNKRWFEGYFRHLYCDQNYPQNYSSDERIKNSIEPLPEKYEVFFDKMEPTRYKYNDGASNRYHTGFIAQQLVKSLEESDLTTQDFAGVMLNHPGEEDECWYLRRDEFVALNTWQIQKLKARVKQAEETIELQDTYIKKLEERIEKLEQKLL